MEENKITKTPHFDVGKGPSDIEIMRNGLIYVLNTESDSVSVIDSNPMTSDREIPVGKDPTAMETDGDKLYVTNSGSDSVSVISTNNNTMIKNIPVGDYPLDIKLAVGSLIMPHYYLYVSNFDSGDVSIINTTSDTEIDRIPVSGSPRYIAIPENFPPFNVYVSAINESGGGVSVIDIEPGGKNDSEINWVPVGENPVEIKAVPIYETGINTSDINPNDHKIYVSNSDYISVISVSNNTVSEDVKKIPVGAVGMAVDNGYMYIANGKNLSVVRLIDDTLIDTIPVGLIPTAVAIIDINLYTAFQTLNSNTSIDSVMVDMNYNKIYVSNSESKDISVINANTSTEIERIPIGKRPGHIEVDDRDMTVYIATPGKVSSKLVDSGSVTVVNGKTDKTMAGISFDIEPFIGGRIVCNDDFVVPLGQSFYVDYAEQCQAQPNKGYQFTSWTQTFREQFY